MRRCSQSCWWYVAKEDWLYPRSFFSWSKSERVLPSFTQCRTLVAMNQMTQVSYRFSTKYSELFSIGLLYYLDPTTDCRLNWYDRLLRLRLSQACRLALNSGLKPKANIGGRCQCYDMPKSTGCTWTSHPCQCFFFFWACWSSPW